jgi:hypothetical protein
MHAVPPARAAAIASDQLREDSFNFTASQSGLSDSRLTSLRQQPIITSGCLCQHSIPQKPGVADIFFRAFCFRRTHK